MFIGDLKMPPGLPGRLLPWNLLPWHQSISVLCLEVMDNGQQCIQ